jgi:hypothetical protein
VKNEPTNRVAPDKLVLLGVDPNAVLEDGALESLIAEGKLTRAEADEILQAAERRLDATEGPAPDPETDDDGTVTEGGFGAGQGMASQSKRHGYVTPIKPS